ncbi:bifunctional diguanylate cyclase/phosphodiesterase [Acholeplasma sp. OttesenSCG-928-E16]|nr:bifunctional diguanylate cyclase/phosphodiesterase [Acholeplasma sp. OttesenSCG-928-E16]
MTKRVPKKKKSIFMSFLVPMLIVLFVQTIAFVGSMIIGGTFSHINNTSIEFLDGATTTAKNSIDTYYADHWTNLDQSYDDLIDNIDETIINEGASYEDLINKTDDSLYLKVSLAINETLFQSLRINSVTGSFVAFGNSTGGTRYGLYLKDSTPQNNSSESDVRVVISPNDFPKQVGLERGFNWKQYFYFDNPSEGSDGWNSFYNTPLSQYILRGSTASATSYAWFSPAFSFHDARIITYSLPLVSKTGSLIGVFGVELDCDTYLTSLLPHEKLPYTSNGVYALGVISDFEKMDLSSIVVTDNTLFKDAEIKVQKDNSFDGLYKYNIGGTNYLSSIKVLKTYPNNSPYESEVWYIIGLVPERDLFSKSNTLITIFSITVTASFLLGILIIAFSSFYFSKPIMELTHQIKSSSDKRSVHFKDTNIKEIDNLTDAIGKLNHEVVESETKLSNILSLVDLPIVAFEYNVIDNTHFLSGDLSKVIYLDIDSKKLNPSTLHDLILELNTMQISNEGKVYTIKYMGNDQLPHWLDLRMHIDYEKQKSGIMVDVTAQYIEKEKLIFERNIDSLTGIYNRRAFSDKISSVFSNPQSLKQAAFVMMDLDNLKFINDTYGHDFGDEYLRLTGSIIHASCRKLKHCLYGRRSGDEFYIFLYGYDGFGDLSDSVMEILKNINAASLSVPDGGKHRVRISSGISLYPQDSLDPDELMHLADYAMYEAKTSAKGSIKYFDRDSYEKNAYIIQNKEALDTLIEKELVDYHFQPIVNLKTGEVFGYESLMRSKVDTFKTPLEIIGVAQSQHKINQLEKLTFFKTLEKYQAHKKLFEDKKLFINSFSNQIMSPLDIDLFLKDYKDLFKNLVVEMTNYDKSVPAFFNTKKTILGKHEGKIALDNYGKGFTSDSGLLNSSIDYIKIDMSLIRNIDQDMDKVSVLLNIIMRARDKGIKTIAEGVETLEELEVIIKLGCDYGQGFYFGRPLPLPKGINAEVTNKILEISSKHYGKN